jgi:hypothetical protein
MKPPFKRSPKLTARMLTAPCPEPHCHLGKLPSGETCFECSGENFVITIEGWEVLRFIAQNKDKINRLSAIFKDSESKCKKETIILKKS